MINSVDKMKCGDLYTTDGRDVWEVEFFFAMPSVTLKNLRTGVTTTGGVGCLNFEPFVPLLTQSQADKLVKQRVADELQTQSLADRKFDSEVKHRYVCEEGPEIKRPDQELERPVFLRKIMD